MQKNFIYHDAIISYRVEGKGDPVVLIHGFGEDSHIWDQQVSFLKEHCLLIIPDLPGSGKSSILSLGFGVWSLGFNVKQIILFSLLLTSNSRLLTPNLVPTFAL